MDLEYTGAVRKMVSTLADPVSYSLPIGDYSLSLDKIIGSDIRLEYDGEIICVGCGNQTKKSFAQGFCYPCFISSPLTSECILRPELCEAHNGVSRDMEWSERHCLTEHIVYIALTAGMKVGVTRDGQIPTRWIDQGAVETAVLARTPNRHLAGRIEVCLKSHISDRTSWQKMLKNDIDPNADIILSRLNLAELLEQDLAEHLSIHEDPIKIKYPVLEYPEKVRSLSFDKESSIEGTLKGIKGQYLYLNDNRVLNIRKHTGYVLKVLI